jgi:hypothetical protein
VKLKEDFWGAANFGETCNRPLSFFNPAERCGKPATYAQEFTIAKQKTRITLCEDCRNIMPVRRP